MGKATGKEKTGERALEIAEQINLAKEMLIGFSRPGEICDALADNGGYLSGRLGLALRKRAS